MGTTCYNSCVRRQIDILRPCMTLAIIPVAPSAGYTLSLAVPLPWSNWVFSMNAFSGLIGLTICLCVWLRLIQWTAGRFIGTTSATAALLVHLVLWLPIRDVGCVNDMLITAQGLTLFGAWMWVMPIIWWGASGLLGSHVAGSPTRRMLHMHTLPTGFLRAVGLVPLVVGIFVITAMLIDDVTNWGEPALWIVSITVGAVVVVAGWVWAWRQSVVWTSERKSKTGALSIVLVILSAGAGFIDGSAEWVLSLRMTLPLLMIGAYMIVTARIWQGAIESQTTEEPEPLCPACGYNMTGLYEARCPECGNGYTLDELFSANLR